MEFIEARGGRITARALQKSNSRKYRDADQARLALDQLVAAGGGSWTKPEIGPKGGQPSVWFILSGGTGTYTTDTTDDDGDDTKGLGARQCPPPPDS
ncbi:MAG TPA: hypothetical protein VL371_01245, partial [Gemmataceae bacterium]|nr:hypothetical protein [Gemmataceae bacterium]